MFDVVIIGNGPAGLSAAVYAKRAMLETVVIGKQAFLGGQIVNSEQVDNYLGLPGTKGFDLVMKFMSHAEELGVIFREGMVTNVVDNGEYKTVELEQGEPLETKTVLVASGAKYRLLGIEGEAEYAGAGVSYCATCDGAFHRGKDVAVIGGGDVALGDAVYLSKGCRNVYLIHRRNEFRGTKVLQERVREAENIEFLPFYEVQEIHGGDVVEKITLRHNQTGEEKTLEVSGVFIAVGMEPQTGFVKGVVPMDKAGYIIADETGVTGTKGIFVAGDARTKKLRQVATAVSDGANAVISIEEFLTGSLN
ncbi:MAG: FAD-dependent oxidoreductase [Lachnospiraceae bacterium]|nr:FAD-dependent oxidoreductase [Lachnospiraceae bacterium]